jgi:hypothetical protein
VSLRAVAAFVAPLRAELFRLTRSRAGRVGLLVPAILGALQVLGADVLARAEAVRRAAQGLGGGGRGAAAEAAPAFGPLADGLGGLGAIALAMIALLTGAFSLARERDLGGLSLLALARSRGALVVGKTLGTCAYVITAFVALFAASFLAASISHDFTAVVEDGYEMASAAELWNETLHAVGAGMPAVLCCACFGVLVSSLSPSVGAAAVGAVVPFSLLALFQSTLGDVADQLFVTYAPFFSPRAPLSRLAQVSRAFSDAHWEQGELLRAALVPTLEGIAFVVLAWVVTSRRDV